MENVSGPSSNGQPNNQPTVFIVDGNPLRRAALSSVLEEDGLRTRVFIDGATFIDGCFDSPRECVLLAMRLPDMSAVEVLGELARFVSLLPVVVFANTLTIPDAVEAMKSGASTVIQTPIENVLLLQTVRAAMESSESDGSVARGLARLSKREREVLRFLLDAASCKTIAKALGISFKTVEKHRANVLVKMNADSQAELLLKVIPWKSRLRYQSPNAVPLNQDVSGLKPIAFRSSPLALHEMG